MGSIKKLFTKTYVIKLLEGSELKFSNKVGKYLGPEILKGIHTLK
jgi:hypothetical protein